jgi:uncharacterized membrane protein YhaH (DUF805 family)
MFQHPFSFKGRIRRLEYGLSLIITFIYLLILKVIGKDLEMPGSVAFVFFVPVCWFLLAQGAKRCHDRGYSGWHHNKLLMMLFANGEYGENRYGPNPKGDGN